MNHTVITEGETEVASNHSGETLSDKETNGNNLATSAVTRSDQNTFNNARPKIRSVINAQNYPRLCNSSNVYAITEKQDPDQTIQDTDIAAYVDYLQAGDVVTGWELIYPDDNSVNAVSFREKTADNIKTDDPEGHLIRVKIGQ